MFKKETAVAGVVDRGHLLENTEFVEFASENLRTKGIYLE
jgi:hypothetical protein